MNRGLRLALPLLATALVGCSVPSNSPTGTNPTGVWANWQIQAGTAITYPPNTYPTLLGAVQNQTTPPSGIFSTVQATGTAAAQNYSGMVDSASGQVTLGTYGLEFSYIPTSTPYIPIPVNVIGGCVVPPGSSGPVCNAIFSSPSVGVQIASLSGTYTGTLTVANSPTLSGMATLVLTQTATPNTSGQFPLSGTITFPAGSGFGTAPLGGTVSGEGITLSDSSAAPNSPTVNVTASASPDGSQLTVTNLLYSGYGPGAVFIYTGTLTRQ